MVLKLTREFWQLDQLLAILMTWRIYIHEPSQHFDRTHSPHPLWCKTITRGERWPGIEWTANGHFQSECRMPIEATIYEIKHSCLFCPWRLLQLGSQRSSAWIQTDVGFVGQGWDYACKHSQSLQTKCRTKPYSEREASKNWDWAKHFSLPNGGVIAGKKMDQTTHNPNRPSIWKTHSFPFVFHQNMDLCWPLHSDALGRFQFDVMILEHPSHP